MAVSALEFISCPGYFLKVCPSQSQGRNTRFFGYVISPESGSTLWIREISFTERTVRYFNLECQEEIFDVSLAPGDADSGFEIVCLTRGGLLLHYRLNNNNDLEMYSEYRLRECANAVRILAFFWDQYTKRAVVALKTNTQIVLTSTVFAKRDGKQSLSEYTRIIKDLKSSSGASGFFSLFKSPTASWHHRFLAMSSAAVGWVLHLVSATGQDQQDKLTLTLQCFASNNTGQNLSKEQELGMIYQSVKNARILVENSSIIVLVETENCSSVDCWFVKFSIGCKVSLFVLEEPEQLQSLPVGLIDDAVIQNSKVYAVAGGKVFVSTDLRYIERFDWTERKYISTLSTIDWGVARDYFNLLCASTNPEILRKVLRSFSFNEEIGQTPMSQVASVIRQGVQMGEFLSRLRQHQTGVELTGIAKISIGYDSPILLYGDGWGYTRELDIAENVLQKSQVVMGISGDLIELINRALRMQDASADSDALNTILQHPGEGMYEMLLKQLELSSRPEDETLAEEQQYCADTPVDDLAENQLIGVFSKDIEVITFEELGTILAARFVVLTRVLIYLAKSCPNSERFPRLESTIRRMLFLRVVAVELGSGSKSNLQRVKGGEEAEESWVQARTELLNNKINLWTLDCFKYCCWAWREKSWRCLKILAVIVGGISKTRLANVFLARSILGIRFHDNTLGLTWASGLYSPSDLFGAFWDDLMEPDFVDGLSDPEKDFLFKAIDPDSSLLGNNPSEHTIRLTFGEFVVRMLQSVSARMSLDNEDYVTDWYLRLSKLCEDSHGEGNRSTVNRAISYQITAVERYLRQMDFNSAQKILTEMDINSSIRAPQQKMDALRHFVKTACEKKQIGAVVGLDWKSMTTMVEKAIKEYCKMKSSYQFHSHEVLWAFYVTHNKHQKAAWMMLLLLKRLEAKALKLPRTHLAHNVDRQLHCLTNLINALSLLPKGKRSVSIAKRKVLGEALKQDESKREEVYTYDDCLKRYRILVGWKELFSRINISGPDLSQDHKSDKKLISGLIDLSKHEMALTTGVACGMDVTIVFENYVEWICSFINRDRAPGFNGAPLHNAVALDEMTLWNHFGHYLKAVKSRNDRYKCILAVTRKVLGRNFETEPIPGLVLEVLKEVGGRPALVRMLCKFGRLEQAVSILQDMANDAPLDFDLVALVVGHIEQKMRQLVTSNSKGKLVEQRDSLIELIIKS